MIYQKRLTFLQNSVYPLSFDTSYKIYWPCMNKHWPFQMVTSKMICAEWEFKGLTGSGTIQNKGTCWKTFIGISFVSFVMFLLLIDSLFWHGLASLNLVIVLNTIILRKSFLTCMSLNCSLSFMHWDIIMCLVSNERRENALDNEAYSLFQSCVAMKISHW